MYSIINLFSIVAAAAALVCTVNAGIVLEAGRRNPAGALIVAAVAAVVAVVAFVAAELARKAEN